MDSHPQSSVDDTWLVGILFQAACPPLLPWPPETGFYSSTSSCGGYRISFEKRFRNDTDREKTQLSVRFRYFIPVSGNVRSARHEKQYGLARG